ncbi:MAG TPA: glycogen/starch synthase [Pyrinomonadaceae bacterium]|nr:glycogen/starch synthase [Pyrinomonadaceae bacterium]
MRVAILSSEAVPFAKTGGLADVAGALPKALRGIEVDVLLVLPLHQQVNPELLSGRVFDNLEVEWRGSLRHTRVWYSEASSAPTYLIEAHEYFARPTVYGFADDHERFAFFCRAALTLLKRLGAPPDVVHCNDWPGGFAAVELRSRRSYDPYYAQTRTLFSVHNIAYQGAFDPGQLWIIGFGSQDEINTFMFEGLASALKAGLMASDALSTVSQRYALEIQTPEQGYGLDWLLRARNARLVGITNGVDYDVWNPATDPHIVAHYSADDLAGKRDCKLDLLRRFGLPEDEKRPVIASISRLVAQKGYDLIKEAAGSILQSGAVFIALGSGDKEYEDFLQAMRDHAPRQVGIYLGFNEPLAHQIEAGADLFLMPSLYEPCGLNQMYSVRYGTVPLVRATGGLDDTVQNFDPATGAGNGFKFGPYSAAAMLEKIHEALYFYTEPETWRIIQLNGMRTDHSWSAAAQKYLNLYRAMAQM